jgi:hypothetical protein
MRLHREPLDDPARDARAEGDGARLGGADRAGYALGPVGLRDVRGGTGLQKVGGEQG